MLATKPLVMEKSMVIKKGGDWNFGDTKISGYWKFQSVAIESHFNHHRVYGNWKKLDASYDGSISIEITLPTSPYKII
jgi:hypothetical protein